MDLVVWDLHGVMETGNELATLEFSNKALELAGRSQRFSLDDIRAHYGLPWRMYFKDLVPGVTDSEARDLEQRCFEYGEAHADVVEKATRPTKGLHAVLKGIQRAGHEQIVISTTRPEGLAIYLGLLGIEDFFPEGNRFAVQSGEKLAALNGFLDGSHFQHVLVVGDNQTDVGLARAVGGIAIAYTHPDWPWRVEGEDYFTQELRAVQHIVQTPGERYMRIHLDRFHPERMASQLKQGMQVRLFLGWYEHSRGEVLLRQGELISPAFPTRKGARLRLKVEGSYTLEQESKRILREDGVTGRLGPGNLRHRTGRFPYIADFRYESLARIDVLATPRA